MLGIVIPHLSLTSRPRRARASFALVVLAVGAMLVGCWSGPSSGGESSEAPVAVPLDRENRGGKYPDTDYAVPIEPRWGADDLDIGSWIASDRYDHLDGMECEGVAAALPEVTQDTPSRAISIELGRHESVNVECQVTFDGETMVYAIEWPNIFRKPTGEVDFDRSDLSSCHVGNDEGPTPTEADLVPDSRLIECDLSASIARSSPSDYWLSPQPLIIYP